MNVERFVLGTRRGIAGTVYGTIVVLATLAAGGSAYKDEPWRLVGFGAGTVIVLWAAHVYAHGLGESLELGRRLDFKELSSIARRESSILFAGVLPLAAISLGALGVLKHKTAFWLGVGIGVATLAAQGLRYARLERMTAGATVISVALNLALGLVIVLLKIIVGH